MPHGTRELSVDRRRCYLHHGSEELVVTDPAARDAKTVRRIVRGLLDSGSPYVLEFIGDQCVIQSPTLDGRAGDEASSA